MVAFTLLEIFFSLLISSLLMGVLISTFVAFKASYQGIMAVLQLQDDGRFATSLLRREIHNADDVEEIISSNQKSNRLLKRIKAKSDVLVLRYGNKRIAYYLASASWKQNNKRVVSLFRKPLQGRREELVPHIVQLHFKQAWGGVAYSILVKSTMPLLRYVSHLSDRHVYRQWFGMAFTKN